MKAQEIFWYLNKENRSCMVLYKHTRDDLVIAEIYRVNKQYQVKRIKLTRL